MKLEYAYFALLSDIERQHTDKKIYKIQQEILKFYKDSGMRVESTKTREEIKYDLIQEASIRLPTVTKTPKSEYIQMVKIDLIPFLEDENLIKDHLNSVAFCLKSKYKDDKFELYKRLSSCEIEVNATLGLENWSRVYLVILRGMN